MKPFHRLLQCAFAVLTASASARADLIEQFVPGQRDCAPCTWFQTLLGGGAAPNGHSGVMQIASMPVGTFLASGWLSFTPQGTFLTLYGGGSSTTEILTPGGAPLSDVRGAALLATAFGIIVDTGSGSIVGVTLYSGMILWTPTNTYLLLTGGIPTVYDITVGGVPIAGTRGVARLEAAVIDTDPGIGVAATLFSGAVVYTPSKAFLALTGGVVTASELLLGGVSIGGVRGVTAMGGSVAGGFLDSGSFLWTPSRVLLMLTGGGISISEVFDPVGGSIANVWGITRQSPLYPGGGFFQGMATVINDTKEHLVIVSGGVSTTEVTRPGGGSITSNVSVPPSSSLLRQASGLTMMFGSWNPPGSPAMRGTVLGSIQ